MFASPRGGVPTEAVGARPHLTFFYLRAFRFARRCRVLRGTVSGSGARSRGHAIFRPDDRRAEHAGREWGK